MRWPGHIAYGGGGGRKNSKKLYAVNLKEQTTLGASACVRE
jgi:hypothetical protein